MTMTPRELAQQIGVSEKTIRKVARELFRPNGEHKNARWHFDDDMVVELRRELGK